MAFVSHLFALSCLLGLAHVLLVEAQRRDKNPCHPNRDGSKLGTDCELITMPKNMCGSCKLRGYDSRGNMNDCASIYRLEDQKCKTQLEKYVTLNPCDTVRKDHMMNFDSKRKELDYFVYSICEECCDCIPKGATEAQFAERSKAKTLINLNRGNCPAHAHYDVCRVWPEVRHLIIDGVPGAKFRPTLPKICPLIRSWFFSDKSRNWFSNQNVEMDWRIRRFLRIFNRFARCRKKETWLECVGLEKAQSRI